MNAVDNDKWLANSGRIYNKTADTTGIVLVPPAPACKEVFASDFDRIVSEGAIKQAPNPAPSEIEKK